MEDKLESRSDKKSSNIYKERLLMKDRPDQYQR